MKTYMIIASTSSFDAERHYNGEQVIRKETGIPVSWIARYNGEDLMGLTLEEAHKALDELAGAVLADRGAVVWYDDELLAAFREDLREEEEEEPDLSWYKGEGWYNGMAPSYLNGETGFVDDVVTYLIREE